MKNRKKETISFKMHIEWDKGQEDLIKRGINDDLSIALKDELQSVIPEMKNEFNKFADNAIEEVRVDSIYDGSVIVLFTVIWNAAKTIKDVYDIGKMVREVSELFIKQRLKDKYKYNFRVDTYYLNKTDPYKDYHRRYPGEGETDFINAPVRDSFFYYLLVANIVQALIIAALVFGAVTKVYF